MGRARQKKKSARTTTEASLRPTSSASVAQPVSFVAPHFLAICVALTVAALVAYSPVRLNDFVYYDDPKYVTENPVVLGGLTAKGFAWALRTGTDANWFPLTWLSHMLDVQLFGLNAGAHHLTSLLWHIANTLILFFALYSMTRALWPAAFVASLFAVHPLHVESVAWVAERKDVLSTFWWLLTLIAYSGYAKKPRIPRYLLCLLLFALGLLSKPMVVTLPFVLLLLDYWPLARFRDRRLSQLVTEKIPFIALAIASSVVTFLVQRKGGAVRGVDAFPIVSRIGNAFISYVTYLEKMLWPSGLAAFYPYPNDLSAGAAAVSAILLTAISVAVVRLRSRYPYAPVGWFWYLGTLIPVIGLIQVGNQSHADRYTYLPMIGVLIIAAWGVKDISSRWKGGGVVLPALTALLTLVCVILTNSQVRHWQSSSSLWTHALQVTDENYVAHNNLGLALAEKQKLDDAILHYNEALRIRPGYKTARTNLGVALAKLGKYDEAIAQYQEVLRADPTLADAHTNLGAALADQGKIDAAIEQYKEAVRLKPEAADAHANYGLALGAKGDLAGAVSEYNTALRYRPLFPEVQNNLGFALASLGNFGEAVKHYSEAIRTRPNFVLARVNLGIALANLKKNDEAVREFKEVLRIEPSNAAARGALTQLGSR